MPFNSPDEVRAWCDEVVLGDMRHFKEHAADLNPFSTDGARYTWQCGYDGVPARSWETPSTLEYDTIYQRGAAMRRLIDKQS